MPMATLKYPRTLTTRGKQFRRGISEPVSEEVASALINDSRFEILGFMGDKSDGAARNKPSEQSGRPFVRAVRLEQIRVANGVLDPDVTENYTVDGKPSIAGLAKAMGWTPDQGEINEALRIKRRSGELTGDGDSVAVADAHREVVENIDKEFDPGLAVSEVGANFTKYPIDDNGESKLTAAELEALPASRFPPNVKAVIGKRNFKPEPEPKPEKSASLDD